MAILDHTGRPIATRQRMRQEDQDMILGMRRKRFAGVIAGGLTPTKLVSIFSEVDRGQYDQFLTLAKELQRHDSHYRSVLGIRKLAVLERPCKVIPASEDTRDVLIAEELQAMVDSPEWMQLSAWLLDALGKGYAVTEIIWDFSSGQARPRFKRRDPRDFTADQETLTTVVRKRPENPGVLEPLPWGKYVVHSPSLEVGSPVDGALATTEAILYLYGALALHDLGDFLERFGSPTLLGKYTNEKQRGEILDGLKDLARAGYGAIPESTKVDILDGARVGGGENIHQSVIELLDRQKSKLVLGQTMTSDQGSSRSQAEVHERVEERVHSFDVGQLCSTQVEQVFRVWAQLNYGDIPVPKLARPGDDEGDVKDVAEVLFGVADRGGRVPTRHLLDLLGVPEAEDDSEILEPISTGKGDVPGRRLSDDQAAGALEVLETDQD